MTGSPALELEGASPATSQSSSGAVHCSSDSCLAFWSVFGPSCRDAMYQTFEYLFKQKQKNFKAQQHSCVPEWLLTAFSHLTSSVQLPSSCCHGCSGPAGHRIATHTAGPAFWPTRSPRVISPSAIALSLHPLA